MVKSLSSGLDRFTKKMVYAQFIALTLAVLLLVFVPFASDLIGQQNLLIQSGILGIFEAISYIISDKFLVK